jgi:DNA replication protein DnaC
MGFGTVTDDEDVEHTVFCECRLREWEWDNLQHWRKFTSLPKGVKLPSLDDFTKYGGSDRWEAMRHALDHAYHLTVSPTYMNWMTLMGGVGTGKTMLLLAIYAEIKPYAVYLGAGDLTSQIFESFGKSGETEDLTEALARVPVLLLDDYGIGAENKTVQGKITQILDHRYRLRHYRPTVVATNLNRKDLSKSNARVASRILDQDLVRVREIRLPDYRRRDEQAQQSKTVRR